MQSTLKCCLWVLWLLKNSFSVKNTLYLSIYKNKRINKLEPAWLFLFSFRHLHILLVGIPLVCANLWVFCRHWEAVTAPPLPQASGQIFKQSPLCSRLQLTLHYLNLTSQLASQLCPVFFTPFSLISRSIINIPLEDTWHLDFHSHFITLWLNSLHVKGKSAQNEI